MQRRRSCLRASREAKTKGRRERGGQACLRARRTAAADRLSGLGGGAGGRGVAAREGRAVPGQGMAGWQPVRLRASRGRRGGVGRCGQGRWVVLSETGGRDSVRPLPLGAAPHRSVIREAVGLRQRDKSDDLFHRGYTLARHDAARRNPSLRSIGHLSLRIVPQVWSLVVAPCQPFFGSSTERVVDSLTFPVESKITRTEILLPSNALSSGVPTASQRPMVNTSAAP